MGYGLGLLGAALSGVGHGAADMAGRYIDRETDDLKQQRLAELGQQTRADQEQIDIRAENRGLLNNVQQKRNDIKLMPEQARAEAQAALIKNKSELDFKTNPNNVSKATDAEIQAQRRKDSYKDERLPQEIANEKLKNPVDQQEAQLKMQKVQADIDHLQNADVNDKNKTILDAYKAQLGAANDQLEALMKQEPADDAEILARNQALLRVNATIDAISKDMAKAFKSSEGYGKRPDGTDKGAGYLGELKMTDGSDRVVTEMSIGVQIDGKETQIPTVVPTLNQEQLSYILKGGDVTKRKDIIQAAVDHAGARIEKGLSPYADDGGTTNDRANLLYQMFPNAAALNQPKSHEAQPNEIPMMTAVNPAAKKPSYGRGHATDSKPKPKGYGRGYSSK